MSRSADFEAVGPTDHLFIRGDRWPETRSAMVALFDFETPPSWDDLVAAFDGASRRLRRLRQRVVAPLLPVTPPRWVTAPDFDLGRHLVRRPSPGRGDLDAVLELVAAQLQAPLAPGQPLWEATFLEGFDGDRAALLLKAGHALTDGVGALQLLGALAAGGAAPDDPGLDAVAIDARDLTVDGLRDLPASMVGGVRRLTEARPDLGRLLDDLKQQMRSMRPATTGSPLLALRSHRRAVMVAEVATAELRAAAKGLGATVNDLYLAVLAAAFCAYHAARGRRVASLPVAMPVNLRSGAPADDAAASDLANHWTVLQLALPLTRHDPAALLPAIGAMVRVAKAQAPDAAFGGMARVAGLLPDPVLRATFARAARPDLQASNIVGPSTPLSIAGGKVRRVVPFAPLPGCAAMATLLSLGGVSTIGIHYDPAAITDPVVFQACLDEALAALIPRST